jgi:DNA polymerase III alpha subunit
LTIGISEVELLLAKEVGQWNWFETLTAFSDKVPSPVFQKIIQVGALRWLNVPRAVMLAEFNTWIELTNKEKQWIRQSSYSTLLDAIKNGNKPKKLGGACSNKNRVAILNSLVSLLESPPSPLVDTPNQIAYYEEENLGISISCSKVDSCDTSQVNCSCKEFLSGRTGFLILCVEIQERKEVKTKKGKTPGARMGRLTVSDGSCSIDAVAFPDAWKEYETILTEGNTVLIQGGREKNADYDSLIVKKVWQA